MPDMGRQGYLEEDYSDFNQYPDRDLELLSFVGSSRPPPFPYTESRTGPAAILTTTSRDSSDLICHGK